MGNHFGRWIGRGRFWISILALMVLIPDTTIAQDASPVAMPSEAESDSSDDESFSGTNAESLPGITDVTIAVSPPSTTTFAYDQQIPFSVVISGLANERDLVGFGYSVAFDTMWSEPLLNSQAQCSTPSGEPGQFCTVDEIVSSSRFFIHGTIIPDPTTGEFNATVTFIAIVPRISTANVSVAARPADADAILSSLTYFFLPVVPTSVPSPTATDTPTIPPTMTPEPTATNTVVPTATTAPTNTPEPTATTVPTTTPANTPEPTHTPEPTSTYIPTSTFVPTVPPTNVPTTTPTTAPSPTASVIPSTMPTNTPEPSATTVPTSTLEPTSTNVPVDTPIPTLTTAPTATPEPSIASTFAPTSTIESSVPTTTLPTPAEPSTSTATAIALATATSPDVITPEVTPSPSAPVITSTSTPSSSESSQVIVFLTTINGGPAPENATVCIDDICQSLVWGAVASADAFSGNVAVFTDIPAGDHLLKITDAAPYRDRVEPITSVAGSTLEVQIELRIGASPTDTAPAHASPVSTTTVNPTTTPDESLPHITALPNTGASSGERMGGVPIGLLVVGLALLLIAALASRSQRRPS